MLLEKAVHNRSEVNDVKRLIPIYYELFNCKKNYAFISREVITIKVVGYVRVSTDEQVRAGVSLEAQKAKILSWSTALDYKTICIEEDAGISGKNIRAREGLQRALNKACAEKAILVVYSLSRLSRSTKDTLSVAEMLDAAGADLVSLSERIDTTTAAGKMVFRMLAVLNEFERDQISERTSAILQHKKSKLEAYSPTPYGKNCFEDFHSSKTRQKL